jgi:hypothetical protein
MIEKALTLIQDELQNYLNAVSGVVEDAMPKVILTNVVDDSGTNILNNKQYGMTLVNIEEERIMKAQNTSMISNGQVVHANPVIKLNLYILFSSYMKDKPVAGSELYRESLKFISRVITFFQGKNVFNHENSPALDSKIEKLVMELYTLGLEQQNYLWGAIGSKLIPSVMYKMKLVVINDLSVIDKARPIEILKITE